MESIPQTPTFEEQKPYFILPDVSNSGSIFVEIEAPNTVSYSEKEHLISAVVAEVSHKLKAYSEEKYGQNFFEIRNAGSALVIIFGSGMREYKPQDKEKIREVISEANEQLKKEKGLEGATVEVEYTLTDSFGQVKFEGKKTSFDLGEIPQGASYFDGYIKTSQGDFAFQGPIRLFKEVWGNIKEYCKISGELETLSKELKEAEDKHEVSISRWANRGDDKGYSETFQKERELRNKISLLKSQLAELSKKVSPHHL